MRSRIVMCLFTFAVVAAAVAATLPGWAGEEDAIAELAAEYRNAFNAGDAETLARCFTVDAEYRAPGGEVFEGREEIRDLAEGFFVAHPGAKVTGETLRSRLLGEDSALREGLVTITAADGSVFSRMEYTAALVRKGDQWLIATLTERPHGRDGLTPREHLESLAWLVGDWHDETDAALIRSNCRWSDDGPFLIQRFTIRDLSGETRTATQRIGWDGAHGKIRSWIWDSDGGYGGAVWTPVEDGWLLQARGVSAEGVVSTGTHRIEKDGDDIMRWRSTGRIVGDEMMPDESHMVVRQPPEPK